MFTKFSNNMHEKGNFLVYSKILFVHSPEGGARAEQLKGVEVNAGLLNEAKQTLKMADYYMREYNIDEKSPNHHLYYAAETVRGAINNSPDIKKARGNQNPDVYLRNKMKILQDIVMEVSAPLEKQKKRFESALKRSISRLPGDPSALQKFISTEWREEQGISLPKQFTFTMSAFEGRTFLVRKNTKRELTISFTRPNSQRNYPLCIGGKMVSSPALQTMMRFLRPTMKEQRELADAKLRNSHLSTLNSKIEKGYTAIHDIYPLLRVMRGWPKGTFKVPNSKLQVRVTADNVIVESDKARYYSLYIGGGRVTSEQFAQHVPSADMIPDKLKPKTPKGPVLRLASSLVGPQYVETEYNHYVVKFRNQSEQARIQIQDIVGKPSDPKMLITVEDKNGNAKQAMWSKENNTWNTVDNNGKLTKNRLLVNNGDRFVDAYPQGQIFEKDYTLK